MLKQFSAIFVCAALLAPAGQVKGPSHNGLFDSIRRGDLAAVKSALAAGGDVNAADADGSTPLMYAALYSSVDCMRLLLDRGAGVNAANSSGATALIWGSGSLDKVELLIEHGADVNARSKLGKTALLSAASRDGNPVAAYLLDHGARIDDGGGDTPLIEAARARDGHALRLLIEKGGDVNARSTNGGTALFGAIAYGNGDNAKLLVDSGASVETAVMGGLTPLMLSAMEDDRDTAALLLGKGAKVDAEDSAGNTALMWAAYSELDRPTFVKVFLAAGANLNHKNKAGETALTYAARHGDTRTVEYLKARGAVDPVGGSQDDGEDASRSTRHTSRAIDKALPWLQKAGPAVSRERGCVSGDSLMLPSIAVAIARGHGHAIDKAALDRDVKSGIESTRPRREMLLENGGGMPGAESWMLIALAAQHYPADAVTDALVHNIAAKQRADGSWASWLPRPPLEYGDIQPTALALHALQLYPLEGRREEFLTRIRKASLWLAQSLPASTDEEDMRLLGLFWSKAEPQLIHDAIQRLLSEQRADGGWGQLSSLASDAYATGETLYALHEAGGLGPRDGDLKHAIEYLLRAQQPDGTWHVRTRAFPFEPTFESGFPYGRDQWISMAASSWATIALVQFER